MAAVTSAQVPPGLPSPTLTNPDMILPFDSPASDSPPQNAPRLPSPPGVAEAAAANGSSPQEASQTNGNAPKGHGVAPSANQQEFDRIRRVNGKIHGRVNGSADELSSGRISKASDGSLLACSPTYQDEFEPVTRGHMYAGSNSRNGQYTSAGRENGAPRPVDLEAFLEETEPGDSFATIKDHRMNVRSVLDEDENDPTSHAAMTKRAEEILANAKKRLTVRHA